jgi:hypothetical protein
MPGCELLQTCVFFNDGMAKMPISAAYFKSNFCNMDNSKCARFIVHKALGKEKVPADMYPTELQRAGRLVSNIR